MRTRRPRPLSVVALLLLWPLQAAAQQEPVRYALSFPRPANHYIEVDATYPTAGKPEIDLFMPVWAPGSYLVREYARNVENVTGTAPDGERLSIEKTSKNHWRLRTGGAREVKVHYRVYSREMGVRTNWVEDRFALVNGAATYVTLADGLSRPHVVSVNLPADWKIAISGLPDADAPDTFLARNFDVLVDSPIVAGSPAVHQFTVAGKPHYLVNVNEPPFWDVKQSVADVQKIVETNLQFWGTLPYDKYVFFNVLTEAGGGLEHQNSVTMMSSRWATGTRRRYVRWLDLVSHEYFHLWNVKRLRPVELGPFNYDAENYTRGLWIAEGLTDYYGGLLLRRAGLVSDDERLADLSSAIAELQTTPGRLVQPLEMASFDAWIKEYRPDENSSNVSISYYTKGAVVGFLLDARIRSATNGRRSLDDVMRTAFDRFSGARGYTPEDFRRVVNEVAGVDLSQWLHTALDSTEELDYTQALDWFGLQFTPSVPARGSQNAWQGLRFRTDSNRLIVSQVRRDSPGEASGINVDDEIVALDEYRVTAAQWDSRLELYKPGDTVSVLVARRDALTRFDLEVGPPEVEQWRLRPRGEATAAQQQRLRAWLDGVSGTSR
jgi:predicted metalloprotease with PDZ domain